MFIREHNNGLYRSDTYFVSKQLADMPLILFTPVLFMCIFYWMVGLNPTAEHFLVAVLITVLINQTAVGMGIMMSCFSPNLIFALAVGPTLLVPLMQVGGFFLNEE